MRFKGAIYVLEARAKTKVRLNEFYMCWRVYLVLFDSKMDSTDGDG